MADGGGPAPGLDLGTQAKLASSSQGGEKEGFDALVAGAISILNLFKTIPVKLNNVGEVSVTTGVDLNKAGIDSGKPLPSVLSTVEMNGGQSPISKMLAAIMKKPDFSNISATIQAAEVGPANNVSMADLGTFRPDFTPAVDRGVSLGASMMS